MSPKKETVLVFKESISTPLRTFVLWVHVRVVMLVAARIRRLSSPKMPYGEVNRPLPSHVAGAGLFNADLARIDAHKSRALSYVALIGHVFRQGVARSYAALSTMGAGARVAGTRHDASSGGSLGMFKADYSTAFLS
jgi:hypothetical protein